MDGKVVIGAELATDKFDRQIAQLEKKNAQLEKQFEDYEVKLNDDSIKKVQDDFEGLKRRAQELRTEIKKVEEIREIALQKGEHIKASTFLGRQMEE